MNEHLMIVTKEQKEQIKTMFFGPYEPEWRDHKGIVDNTDESIAKRLGMAKDTVSSHIVVMLKNHFEAVIKVRDLERELFDKPDGSFGSTTLESTFNYTPPEEDSI